MWTLENIGVQPPPEKKDKAGDSHCSVNVRKQQRLRGSNSHGPISHNQKTQTEALFSPRGCSKGDGVLVWGDASTSAFFFVSECIPAETTS